MSDQYGFDSLLELLLAPVESLWKLLPTGSYRMLEPEPVWRAAALAQLRTQVQGLGCVELGSRNK